jgi:hypothetical protein
VGHGLGRLAGLAVGHDFFAGADGQAFLGRHLASGKDDFLRPPPLGELVAEARMIKLGKRLAVMEATVFSEGHDEPVVHATGTYSIPPDKGK